MENIRASEIRTYYKGTFFGFSRFLLVVFALGAAFATAVGTLYSGGNPVPIIIGLVLSALMFFMFLSKGKWVQLVLAGLMLIFNILLLTGVIDMVGMAERVRQAEEAEAAAASTTLPSSSDLAAINLDNFADTFKSGDSIGLFAIKMSATIYGIVYFIFTIGALKSICAASINNALRAKLEEIRSNPESRKNAGKKLVKKLHKLGRKEKYVDYCHELGVKCILDDPSQNEKYFVDGESEFKGNFLIFFLLNLLWNLLNTITLGIMVPFTTAWKYKFLAEHSVYSGKKVVFDGKGIQLLGRWLLWELLCIVTIGIYAFFMAVELKKWVTKHQHFKGEEGTDSMYTGSAFGRGFMILGLRFIQGISLGLATPYVENTIVRYDMEHTVISGQQLIFGGSALKLLGRFMLWVLFTCITIGVYAILVMPLNMTKYSVSQSRIRDMSYDPESDPR